MKVKDLIKYLQDCDQDAVVRFDLSEVKSADELASAYAMTEYCTVKRVDISLR